MPKNKVRWAVARVVVVEFVGGHGGRIELQIMPSGNYCAFGRRRSENSSFLCGV